MEDQQFDPPGGPAAAEAELEKRLLALTYLAIASGVTADPRKILTHLVGEQRSFRDGMEAK